MTGGRPRTVSVPKDRSAVYLRRGNSLCELLEEAEEMGNLDGIATSGNQAAIAFADAYTVGMSGFRCRGQDHSEVIKLVVGIQASESAEIATLLQRVLNRKSEFEYGDRPVTKSDARSIAGPLREIARLVNSSLA